MDINKVQNKPVDERRSIRINIRITKSQEKYIIENNLSVTKIMNEALKQLGYVKPEPTYRPKFDYGTKKIKRGKGNIRAQKRRVKIRKRYS